MQIYHPYPKFVLVVEPSDGFEVGGVDLNWTFHCLGETYHPTVAQPVATIECS